MQTILFLKGIGIGLTVAAVVGPIAIMLIRRTLSEGPMVGLAIGLGAAIGDATYGLIAGLSLTFISEFLIDHQKFFRFIGGIFLLYLGGKTFFDKPHHEANVVKSKSLTKIIFGTYLLTLSNPVTILSFTAIFSGLDIEAETTNYTGTFILVSAIFIGCMIWNLMLVGALRFFHARMNNHTLIIINKCSGVLIVGFGIASLISLFFPKIF